MAEADAHGRRDRVGLFGTALLLTLAGFLIAYQFVEPAPPRELSLATGADGGAYDLFGRRYREIMARHGVEVRLRNTAGSVENLALLRAGEVDAALLQGGIVDPARDTGLASLGSLFQEPLWVFHATGMPFADLRGLAGRRVAIGAAGSGTQVVARELLARNGVTDDRAELVAIGGGEAADALRAGHVDAALFVASPDSPQVAALLDDPALLPLHFTRAEAYTRRYRFLTRVVLPAGFVDLAANRPARDIDLVAPTAMLAVGADFHPALGDLLLQALDEVHAPGDAFSAPGRFPAAHPAELPLREEATRYYASGPPFLQRFLPFWAATLADRMKVMLVPLLTLLFPLLKVVPPTYSWRVRSRIYRWYRDLRGVEARIRSGIDAETRRWAHAELDRVEAEVAQLSVPLSYADRLFQLRLHIRFVRLELGDTASAGAPLP